MKSINFKKIFSSVLAYGLCLALVFTVQPIGAFAFEYTSDETTSYLQDNETSVSETETAEPYIIKEIESKRDANTKHFLLSDGTYLATTYDVPVHYKDETGAWQQYDNSLEENPSHSEELINKKSDTAVSLSKKAKQNKMVSISSSGYEISWGFDKINSFSALTVSNNSEIIAPEAVPDIAQETWYRNAYNSVDLQYIILPYGVKENIVLKDKNAQNSFIQNYNIKGLYAVQIDSRTIELRDGEGKTIYTLSAPVMTDAVGNESDNIVLTIIKTNSNHISVQITADRDWINSADRQFPITVDPWLEKEGSFSYDYDCYLTKSSSGSVSKNTGAKHIYAGMTGGGINRSFIKLQLPSLGEGDVITKAVMSLNALQNSALGTGNYKVDVHMVTSDWTVENITFDHSYDTNVLDYCVVGPTDEVWHNWDITKAAKYWYETGTNYGLLVKGNVESGIVGRRFCGFKSSVQAAMPRTFLYYVNMVGLNDYNSYKTYNFGSYGVLNLNEYRGAINYSFSDVAYSGNLLNTNIYHVYNSDWAGDSSKYGKGWMLNINESIRYVYGTAGLSTDYYYRYTDEDGTEIYFKKTDKTNVYEDEVGRGWTLTAGGEGVWMHTLEDKSGNKKGFDYYGLLSIVRDANGNEMTYSYVDRIVSSVTDSSGKVTSLTYANGYLSKITDPAGREINYIYDESGNLLRAERYDGITPEFTMQDNRLYRISVGDSDIVIKYHSNGNCQSLATAPKDSEGNRFLYWEKPNQTTTLITHPGPSENIGAPDRIYEVCLFNEWGQKVTSYYKKPTGEIIGEIGSNKYSEHSETAVKKNNKVESSSAVTNAENILPDGSFERGGSWNTIYWASHTDTADYLGIETNKEKAYIGQEYGKIYISNPAQANISLYQNLYNLTEGKTYTLSGYVKTENIANGQGAFLSAAAYYTAGGHNGGAFSEYVTGTTEIEIDRGWKRISVTFTVPAAVSYVQIHAGIKAGTSGTVYFDCIQLEEGNEVSDYNLIENGGFEGTGGWSTYNAESGDGANSSVSFVGGSSYKIAGNYSKAKHVGQIIDVYGTGGDVYILSAWVKAASVPLDDTKKFYLEGKVRYTDGTEDEYTKGNFSYTITDWQYLSLVIKSDPTKEPKDVAVYFNYYYNDNSAYFDCIQLIKDKTQSYVYDADGNVTNAVSAADQSSNFEYSDNEVVKSIAPTGHKYYNTYKSDNKHLLIASYADGVSYKFTHDSKGNITSATALSSDIVDGGVYVFRTLYDNFVVAVKDSGTVDNTSLVSVKWSNESNQKFVIRSVPDTEYFTIRPVYCQEKVVQSPSSNTAYGTVICISTNTGAQNQQFKFVVNGQGTYRIVPRNAENMAFDTREYENSTIEVWSNVTDDSKGFVIELVEAGDSTLKTQSSATYTESGQYTDTVTDTLGNTVDYDYNEQKGELTATTDAKGNVTRYENSYGTVSSSTTYADIDKDGVRDNDEPFVTSTYGKGLLNYIYTNNNTYGFGYDIYGNRTSVSVGNRNLITYLYNANNGRLNSIIYGNGASATYLYDDLNRLSQLNYGGYYTYRYTYDKKGNLISLLDEFCNITTTYGYDSIGRLVSSNSSNGFGMYQTYDAFNRINKLVYTKGADTEVYRYIYNDKNLIGSVVLPTGKSISNSYDSLNRLVSKQISDAAGLSVSYTYKAGINGTTSALVETVTTAEGIFSYTYDANGNILTVSKNGVLQESYTYDELGQLKTVTRGTNVYEYTYDNGGNILSVKLNGVVTDTYTYGDANWKDLLTAFNGQTITYDAIGNPLQYRDGMYFEWVRGRTLASIVKDNGNTCINFVVNPDGIRINKNVMRIESGIIDYNFEYNGNLLVRQSWNNNVMWFLYDESGNPVGFTLNDTEYYYIKNLQGDITAITDSNGTILAKYTYDVWGKPLSITDGNGNDVSANKDHIANINPIRYRGYYYDSEMGVYYLLTRYYDPVTRRFINADGYVSTGQGFTGFNMFAYCGNNPVMHVDTTGELFTTVLLVVVVLTVAVVDITNVLMNRATASSNYTSNTELEKDSTKNTIVDDQCGDIVGDMKIGNYNLDGNGCGAVAIHNVKVLKNKESTLSETIKDVQMNIGLVFNGCFGVNPFRVDTILEKSGLKATPITIDDMNRPGVYLLAYWNSANLLDGAHFVAVQYDGSNYKTYNGENSDPQVYAKRLICGYYVE